jgi:hypothetical protein
MQFAFDLISDLHVETWDQFNWEGHPTAPYCVVAGDVSRDPEIVMETLEHLGKQYAGVFYIDGNEEHRYYLEDLGGSYKVLSEAINGIRNVVFMQDNVVIVNGVAILATNGWWTYDFTSTFDVEESIEWYQDYVQISNSSAHAITGVAYHDAAYIINSVNKLQRQQDVSAIVIVSHTLPAPWLIEHDIDLADTVRFNTMGNRHIQLAMDEDTENKIKAWCFGHYHKSIDRAFSGIRYVSNPRGRGNTPWSQNPYYPKRIEIEISDRFGF